MADYGLSAYDADVLIAERENADYFEAVAKGRDGKAAANWVINELFGRLNKEGIDHRADTDFGRAARRHHRPHRGGTISGKIAKDVFEIVWTEGGDPAEDRREARAEAGDRHRRHREGGRRDHRRQSRQGAK